MAREYRKVLKYAEGGPVLDPDDRRRYRKMTKEEEESMGPTSAMERFMTSIANKVNSYKKEDLRNQGPVVGLGPRG